MRIVIDTNVLVSALLTPGRVPDQVLAAIRTRNDHVLYDHRILDEVRDVLSRRKFRAIPPARAQALINMLLTTGNDIGTVAPWTGEMTDPDDRVFVEVALAGRADVLLTGNARHYPKNLNFEVLGPSELLPRLRV